ncbi:MAG: peptidoglycan editing factor PgeF [Eubacteriales bacterium]|nr:peptidoglycan editing factor PgeF [Eubacteriales bacterium]
MENWIGGEAGVSYQEERKRIDGHEVTALTFPALTATGIVSHAFSTRLGGVSQGPYAQMNLGLSRNDRPKAVRENYRLMAAFLGRKPEDVTISYQTHTSTVRVVTEEDRGKGLTRERDYRDVDGLVTNVPGIVLTTLHADCTPLYFVDPVRRAIGLAHSGWRGTVGRIGRETVRAMQETYGSDPADLVAVIGPSICGCCYEVGAEVAEAFFDEFGKESCLEAGILREGGLARQIAPDKYRLDLWAANALLLQQAGITGEHLHISRLCTCENSALLFSHRAVRGGERGNLAAFLSLEA